jgi:hypothetical protein
MTSNFRVVVCVTDVAEPVIVMVEVPVGVPGFG